MAVNSIVIEGFRPPPEFVEDTRDPLAHLNLTDSTEMWLIHLTRNQNRDFDGQEVTLKLHRDGKLGSFEGSSGKEYEVFTYPHEGINPSVFVSSTSGTKIGMLLSASITSHASIYLLLFVNKKPVG